MKKLLALITDKPLFLCSAKAEKVRYFTSVNLIRAHFLTLLLQGFFRYIFENTVFYRAFFVANFSLAFFAKGAFSRLVEYRRYSF